MMIFFLMGLLRWVSNRLGFKSVAWVSNWWLGFANRWLGWWVWWPLLAPIGLKVFVYGSVDGLMVCVCVCVWLCVCGDGFG